MNRLLISAATFLLLASPTLAQPIGKASVAPEVQRRAQEELRGQRQPRRDAGRDDRRGNRGPAPQSRDRRDDRDFGRDYNRDGRTDYRRAYGGPRRDYSGFRDYHRGFNAPRRFRVPPYRRPAGWYERRWTFGEFLPGLFWSSAYWLDDFDLYELPPPPFGTVWVRNGSDALLIDRDTGEIISIRYDVFY